MSSDASLTALYITLPVIAAVYVVGTIALYFWYFAPRDETGQRIINPFKLISSALNDHSIEHSKRSSILAAMASIGVAIECFDGWLRQAAYHGHWQENCTFEIVIEIGTPIFISAFILRIIRICLLVQINRIRRRLNLIDSDYISSITNESGGQVKIDIDEPTKPADSDSIEEQAMFDKLKRYQYWAEEGRLVKISLLFALSWVIVNTLVATLSDSGGLCGDETHEDMNKIIYSIFIFGFLPLSFFAIRKASDAYSLSFTIRNIMRIAGPVFTFSFIAEEANLLPHYEGNTITMVALLVTHSFTIVLPVIQSDYQAKRSMKKSPTHGDFLSTLTNDVDYSRLRDLAADEFSAENPLFWDAYVPFMHRCLTLLANAPDGSVRDDLIASYTGGVIKDGHQLKSEITKNGSALIKVLAGTPTPNIWFDVPMTYSVGAAMVKIYRRFIADEAPLELNVPYHLRSHINPVVEAVDQKLKQFAASNDVTKTSVIVPDLVLRFGQSKMEAGDGKLVVSAHIFDPIKQLVLGLIYSNTFPRYQKLQFKI